MAKITNVITLGQYADKYGLDVKRLRRVARKNEFPGAFVPFKFGNVWAIDTDAPIVTLPPKSPRGNRRDDGRQRYIVYADTVELTAVQNIVGYDNVIDPRVAAKSRRDAKTAAAVDDAKTENDANG